MGSSFSTFSVATWRRQFSNRFLDSNFFNNTKPVDPTTTTTSGSDSAAGGDPKPKQDDSKHLSELVQPRFLAICAGSLSLLVNPPKSIPKEFIVLYKLYLLFLLFSFLPCIALCFIPKGTPSERVAWIHEEAMKIAMVCIAISVALRVFLELPPPIEWYDVFVPMAIATSTLIYYRYCWINASKSGQTASSGDGIESSKEVISSETSVITTNRVNEV